MPTVSAPTLDIGANGQYKAAQGTITADKPAWNSSATWNDGAVAHTHLKANVTDTASAAASLLADLQVGGVSKFSVSKAGAITAAAGIAATTGAFSGNVRAGNAFVLGWTSHGGFESTADGAVDLLNNARGAYGTLRVLTLTATNVAGTLSTAAQPNVTSVGTLTSVTTSGPFTGPGLSTASFAINLTGAGILSPLNTIHTFPAITTGLFVLDQTNGDGAVCFIDAGVVRFLYADTTNVFSLTPSAASKISVYISAGVLKVENKYVNNITLHGTVFKTR